MREGIVDERIGMRQQSIAGGIFRFETNLREEMSDFDAHPLSDRRKISLAVELDRVNAVEVRFPVVGRQLTAKEPAGDGEAIIDAGKNRIAAEAPARLGGPCGD